MEGDRYLDRSKLAEFLGVSARTIDRRVADGSLPPPVLLGPPTGRKVRRWRQSVVVAKLEKRHG
jgi:predicted DNA-binding transcriptional regulator AlpA